MADALQKAKDAALDLVEIAPTANPPVCRIMNFGKFIYQQKKKQQDSKKKQKTTQVKEVKFRPNIDDHDYDFKIKNILKFLAHGDKVKATVQFRGREMARRENGQRVLDRLLLDLAGKAVAESRSEMLGNRLYQILAPVKETGNRSAIDYRTESADAETENPPRRGEAFQAHRIGKVQEGEGLQEPHPDQEGTGEKARTGPVDVRFPLGPQARQGDAALRVRQSLTGHPESLAFARDRLREGPGSE